MASSNKDTGSAEEKGSEVTSDMKNLRKTYCADGTMDKFKALFEQHLKTNRQHQENVKKLHTIMDSGNPSYEEVFMELGGPSFKGEENDDLDAIVKKVAKMKHVTLSDEEKDELFKLWSEVRR